MQYRQLGNTGLIVSRLSFGAMTFTSGNRDIPGLFEVGLAGAERLVGTALDAGINFFDTADVYAHGESEEMLGKLLASRRQDAIIATKCGGRFGKDINAAGLSRRNIFSSVDASLKRLGTDWIDVYIIHRDDPYTPMEETLAALDDIVRAGKVRYLGFSNWSAWRVAAAMEIMRANNLAPFTHGQMYYSLLGRDIEHDFTAMVRQYGLGLTVWSPLAGGFLSGKYRRDTTDADGRLATFDAMPIDRERGYALLDRMDEIAARHDATVAQVALAWLLAQKEVTSILLGAAKPEQLTGNIGALDIALSPEDLRVLDEHSAQTPLYPGWFLNTWGDRKMAKALGF